LLNFFVGDLAIYSIPRFALASGGDCFKRFLGIA
jgi:hypothetical protein